MPNAYTIRKDRLQALLEAIDTIVEEDILWQVKHKDILAAATEMGERYESALEEFASWFLPDEE